jgi:hypothetical protein
MVFMTFNWRHIIREKEERIEKAWLKAVRVTLLSGSRPYHGEDEMLK